MHGLKVSSPRMFINCKGEKSNYRVDELDILTKWSHLITSPKRSIPCRVHLDGTSWEVQMEHSIYQTKPKGETVYKIPGVYSWKTFMWWKTKKGWRTGQKIKVKQRKMTSKCNTWSWNGFCTGRKKCHEICYWDNWQIWNVDCN